MPPEFCEWYGARRYPSDRSPQTAPADRLKSLCGKAPTDVHKPRSNEHRPLQKPAAALFAPDGLRFYRVIAGQWVPKLTPGGLCAVEVGCGQAAAVAAILAAAGLEQVKTVPDAAGKRRIFPESRSHIRALSGRHNGLGLFAAFRERKPVGADSAGRFERLSPRFRRT